VESDVYTLFGDGRAGVGRGNESIELDILYFCYSNSVHLSAWSESMNGCRRWLIGVVIQSLSNR
jgi:hypothetical protein